MEWKSRFWTLERERSTFRYLGVQNGHFKKRGRIFGDPRQNRFAQSATLSNSLTAHLHITFWINFRVSCDIHSAFSHLVGNLDRDRVSIFCFIVTHFMFRRDAAKYQ